MLFGKVKSKVSQFPFSGRFSEFLIQLHEQSPQALWSMGLTRIQGWIHWSFQLKQNAPCMEDAESTIRDLAAGRVPVAQQKGTRGILCCQVFDLLFSPNWCMLSCGHSKGDATNQKGTFQPWRVLDQGTAQGPAGVACWGLLCWEGGGDCLALVLFLAAAGLW